MGTPETSSSSSSSSSSLLEIKVMFAKDIWSFNFFQKLTIYAVAFLSADPNQKKQLSKDQIQEQRTPTDPDGDGNPEWNHPIIFDLSPFPIYPSDSDLDPLPARSHLLLRFELRHQVGIPLLPDKLVGEVTVPLADLLDGFASPAAARFADYQVKGPDGKANGVLRFAYKVPPPPDSTQSNSDLNLGISGYAVVSELNQHNSLEKPPRLYPQPIIDQPDLVCQDDLTGESQPQPNLSYHSAPAAVYPPPPVEEESLTSRSHYHPPPPSEGFWPPPPRPGPPHHPPPPHSLHFFHHRPRPPGPPPAHWGSPPGSQRYHGGGYEHTQRY